MADNEDDYNRWMFGTKYPDKERMEAALEKAHEIRQFEIRLYWQRSLFFWGFEAAFFVAYIAIFSSENAEDLTLISAVIVDVIIVVFAGIIAIFFQCASECKERTKILMINELFV